MPQLILIPGLACGAWLWDAQLAALPAAWQAVATDVTTRHTTIEAMARGLLDEHPGRLVLCGASMGGMVAMEAARQVPERVAGLALLGTSARPETAEMRALREQAIGMFETGRADEVLRANVAFAFDRQHPQLRAMADRYMTRVLQAGAAQLVAQNRAVIGRPDARLHLPQRQCPTLVVGGETDLLTPAECSREIATLVPGAELHLLPHCGHMLTMEQPESVNALLTDWLNRIAR